MNYEDGPKVKCNYIQSKISLGTYFLKIFYYPVMYAYLFEDVKNLAISKVSEDHFGCKNVPAGGP